MQIIFLIGKPGCGKGEVAKIISKLTHTKHFAFGDILREECHKYYGNTKQKSMEKTVKWFHTKTRPRLLAKRMWDRIKNKKGLIIIDGCRNRLQYTHFCKLTKQKPLVVYVYCPRTVRWKRMKKRRRSDTDTYQYLIKREARELKQGLAYMIKIADSRINNSGTKAETARRTRTKLKYLRSQLKQRKGDVYAAR